MKHERTLALSGSLFDFVVGEKKHQPRLQIHVNGSGRPRYLVLYSILWLEKKTPTTASNLRKTARSEMVLRDISPAVCVLADPLFDFVVGEKNTNHGFNISPAVGVPANTLFDFVVGEKNTNHGFNNQYINSSPVGATLFPLRLASPSSRHQIILPNSI